MIPATPQPVGRPTADTVVEAPSHEGDYWQVIETAMATQPRSLQKRIGPSEIGDPCNRAIIHKLAGDTEPDTGRVPWEAYVGTAVHAQLADAFDAADRARDQAIVRWCVEQRVTVGTIGDALITGSCDLFDQVNGEVFDHKVLSNARVAALAKGPDQRYLTQLMLYGLGWENAGHQVNTVHLCLLPRSGAWSKRAMWTAPYDRQVALGALERANQLDGLRLALGSDQAAALYPPCDSPFCGWCLVDQAAARAARAAGDNLGRLAGIAA